MTHIKIAAKDDINDIAEIENICFSAPWSKDSIAQSLANPCSHFYIAYIDDKLAGYMGLQIFSGEGYVTNVATLPAFRKQGVAMALLTEAMKNDMQFITLEVRESNAPAISLYKKAGFQNMGIRPNFYSSPPENAIIMTRYFNEEKN